MFVICGFWLFLQRKKNKKHPAIPCNLYMYIVQPNNNLFKQTQPSLTSYELHDVMTFFTLKFLQCIYLTVFYFCSLKMLLTHCCDVMEIIFFNMANRGISEGLLYRHYGIIYVCKHILKAYIFHN